MELILIAAALLAGALLIVLGRRGRTRSPEGSVFDAAGGSSIRGRKPARPRPQAARDRLGDLGERRTPEPGAAAQDPAKPVADLLTGPTPEPKPDDRPDADLAPPPPTPPAPAPPPTRPAPAPPLADGAPPAWPVAAPPPDWSHSVAPPGAWSSPAGGFDRELADARERAERAERALEAERRERAERERRSDGT